MPTNMSELVFPRSTRFLAHIDLSEPRRIGLSGGDLRLGIFWGDRDRGPHWEIPIEGWRVSPVAPPAPPEWFRSVAVEIRTGARPKPPEAGVDIEIHYKGSPSAPWVLVNDDEVKGAGQGKGWASGAQPRHYDMKLRRRVYVGSGERLMCVARMVGGAPAEWSASFRFMAATTTNREVPYFNRVTHPPGWTEEHTFRGPGAKDSVYAYEWQW